MQSPLTHVLCNYIFTICISITGILKTQVQLKPGDIETNPGLKKSSAIKFFPWNLNGLTAHDFVQVPLIEASITMHNFDIACLPATFLDSNISHNEECINISSYSLLRVNHPNSIKRGGVCLYFKESLPLIKGSDLSNISHLRMFSNWNYVNNEKCFYTCLYRYPSESHEELESFCSSLDSLLSNINDQHPACSIGIGDFNVKYSKWCTTNDKDNTAGLELDNITAIAGYSQIINKPTHFINESSSCIDLIFSSNTSFVKNSGSVASIYEKCDHNIIYETLNFDIVLPPPYCRDVWDYNHANSETIQKAIWTFDRSKAFLHRNANEKWKILTDILLHVFKKFIPHKTQMFYYKTSD